MSRIGLKFSQMILHTSTSKMMNNLPFLLVVLHKPTLWPSTFNVYVHVCTAIIQKQLYAWVIASSFAMLLDGPVIWRKMQYSALKITIGLYSGWSLLKTIDFAIIRIFIDPSPSTYRKSTSIRHFEQCNQQLPNLICQNCDGSIKILLDVGNQQHAV